jgi:hypothetical protein
MWGWNTGYRAHSIKEGAEKFALTKQETIGQAQSDRDGLLQTQDGCYERRRPEPIMTSGEPSAKSVVSSANKNAGNISKRQDPLRLNLPKP